MCHMVTLTRDTRSWLLWDLKLWNMKPIFGLGRLKSLGTESNTFFWKYKTIKILIYRHNFVFKSNLFILHFYCNFPTFCLRFLFSVIFWSNWYKLIFNILILILILATLYLMFVHLSIHYIALRLGLLCRSCNFLRQEVKPLFPTKLSSSRQYVPLKTLGTFRSRSALLAIDPFHCGSIAERTGPPCCSHPRPQRGLLGSIKPPAPAHWKPPAPAQMQAIKCVVVGDG